ncbi:MAG: helix-turn-helix domain-containing protein [Oscillospiraceae bacterium]|nr:helix-turn-helix domain-containing protein [Oscillospiraceae bacterium]
MDQIRTGGLIRQLRRNMHLTQKQLAERLCVSDKAVSKWERGNGSPDISLLSALADVLGTDVCVLLSGEMKENESEKGNMKKLKFYVCGKCGNIVTAASEASVTCCGSRLTPQEPRRAEEQEMLTVEETDGALFVSSDHSMTKEHYVSFAAFLNDSTAMIFRQYPEWNLQFTMPLYRSGRLIWYCTQCGMLYQDIQKRK